MIPHLNMIAWPDRRERPVLVRLEHIVTIMGVEGDDGEPRTEIRMVDGHIVTVLETVETVLRDISDLAKETPPPARDPYWERY